MLLLYTSLIEGEEERRKFEQLYRTYKQTMFYVARDILKDDYSAEDAVHQAFLRIIDNLDKIQEVECHKTRGFLVVIVENIAIDFYRKRKCENAVSYEELEIYISDYNSVESNVAVNEIVSAIAKLPVNYSTVLRLKFSQGYCDKEIAEILHITEENVRQRISRAKAKLSKMLNGE